MRVLILSPTTFGYERRTARAVADLGHAVRRMDERFGNGFAAKALTRLRLAGLMRARLRRHVEAILAEARDWPADMLLILNPETLRGQDYSRLRQALPGLRIVVYCWDSQAQKPLPEEAFAAADAVYSFDPEDCARDRRLRHLPLFHDHPVPSAPAAGGARDIDFLFVGTAHLRRIRLLSRIGRGLRSANRPHVFHLKAQSLPHLVFYRLAAAALGYRGTLSARAIDYAEYLRLIARAACVIDIEYARQSGLTMRSIEVAFSGSRLLTTNPRVRDYDFYDPERVIALAADGRALPEFRGPPPPLPRALFDKYAIRSWARALVEMRQDDHFARAGRAP